MLAGLRHAVFCGREHDTSLKNRALDNVRLHQVILMISVAHAGLVTHFEAANHSAGARRQVYHFETGKYLGSVPQPVSGRTLVTSYNVCM